MTFPIPIPESVPIKISPCPIVDAMLEIHFLASENWATLPGLLFSNIRERYQEPKNLRLMQIPEDIRNNNYEFIQLPLIGFKGTKFIVLLGPRVVTLKIANNTYPGWKAVEEEIIWLLDRLEKSGFIKEGQYLRVTYINFFEMNIFPHLCLDLNIHKKPYTSNSLSIGTHFEKSPFFASFNACNTINYGTQHGSSLDVKVWVNALDFDLFKNGLLRFKEGCQLEKEIFFGLLKPEFLKTLNPEYAS